MNTELLIATFNENIDYLEKSHPKVFSKLLALDNAVANGHYSERYELVFENENFDVVEKDSGNYLYAKSSTNYATLASKSIDYTLSDNLFSCASEHDIDDEKLKYYEGLPPLENYLSALAPILNYIQKKIDEDFELKHLEKFIFFGAGLGVHIESIHKNIEAKQYLIVEDDLELFRLSLFVTNYRNLAKNTELFFSVFDDVSEFSSLSEEFLKKRHEHNRYIKYFEMLSHSEEKRKEFHLSVVNQAHLRFSYTNMLAQSLLPLYYLSDSYQFLGKGITLEGTLLQKKPFLLLGAGPSLQKNVKLLKEKKESFVLVALSATLSFLEKEGIAPDLVIHLDAFEAASKHFDILNSLEFLEDTLFMLSAKTSPLISLRLKRKNLYFFEDSTEYKENSFRPSSPCVGSLAYQILLYLKVENIYLLGLDLAVDSQTGKTHSDFHSYGKILDISENEETMIEYKKHLTKVEGNRGEDVLTTPHFKSSIEAINLSTSMLKKESQVIKNFGDGAKFSEVEFCDFKSYRGEKISANVKEILRSALAKNLSSALTDKEKNSLQEKLNYAKSVREKLISYEENCANSTEEFKETLLKLEKEISQNVDNDLSRTLETYFRYLLPYIFDFLNREDYHVDKKDFKSINDAIVNYLLVII